MQVALSYLGPRITFRHFKNPPSNQKGSCLLSSLGRSELCQAPLKLRAGEDALLPQEAVGAPSAAGRRRGAVYPPRYLVPPLLYGEWQSRGISGAGCQDRDGRQGCSARPGCFLFWDFLESCVGVFLVGGSSCCFMHNVDHTPQSIK